MNLPPFVFDVDHVAKFRSELFITVLEKKTLQNYRLKNSDLSFNPLESQLDDNDGDRVEKCESALTLIPKLSETMENTDANMTEMVQESENFRSTVIG